MIVATPPGGGRFYSNDGQLFCDGDVTIYSPRFLPTDTVLTSTSLSVKIGRSDGNGEAYLLVTDADSGYVFQHEHGLSVQEAGELAIQAFDTFGAEKEEA